MPAYPKSDIGEANPRTTTDVENPKATPTTSQKTVEKPKREQARRKDVWIRKRVETDVETLKQNNRSVLEVPKTRTRMPQN